MHPIPGSELLPKLPPPQSPVEEMEATTGAGLEARLLATVPLEVLGVTTMPMEEGKIWNFFGIAVLMMTQC